MRLTSMKSLKSNRHGKASEDSTGPIGRSCPDACKERLQNNIGVLNAPLSFFAR